MNPYYHYALADSAIKPATTMALGEIQQAISLKRDDHRFYFLEGLVHYRQGDVARARSSLATPSASAWKTPTRSVTQINWLYWA
jgi:hypothetical protein